MLNSSLAYLLDLKDLAINSNSRLKAISTCSQSQNKITKKQHRMYD